jgi:hypothetical protein
MIPSLRKNLLECIDPNFERIDKKDNLIQQLRCEFLALKETEK